MVPFSEYTQEEMEVYNAGLIIIQKRKNVLTLLSMLMRRYMRQERYLVKTRYTKEQKKEEKEEKEKNKEKNKEEKKRKKEEDKAEKKKKKADKKKEQTINNESISLLLSLGGCV